MTTEQSDRNGNPRLTAVRWKRPRVEKSWRYGRLASWREPADANFVAVVDIYTGGVYNVDRKYVQVKQRGPRGGTKWVPMA